MTRLIERDIQAGYVKKFITESTVADKCVNDNWVLENMHVSEDLLIVDS